ncbi:MAG: alpha/beta fold hydrolase [Tabrizicola sp.]|jgi:pimeloyl-ACP methyl ester carboxylesterase|nr:alpha/beta fold hydrolase [Tabrizicola sp.]
MADRYIDVSGLRIRYRDSGGPGLPIVLSHGIAGSLELWSAQLADLGGTHRIIAWDAPNHGLSGLTGKTEDWESYARWLLAFADALRLDQFIAAGNSMGGALSLRVAGLAPGRVKGVVLANSASLGREVFPAFRMMTLPFLGEVMNKPSQKGVDLMLSAIVKDKGCVSGDLYDDLLRNQFKKGGATAFLATLRATTNVFGQRKSAWAPSHKLLSTLDVPMLILHGRQDAVLPLKHSEEAARLARNATLIVLEDCGHTPQIEKPEAVNKALHDFMTRISAAQAA